MCTCFAKFEYDTKQIISKMKTIPRTRPFQHINEEKYQILERKQKSLGPGSFIDMKSH